MKRTLKLQLSRAFSRFVPLIILYSVANAVYEMNLIAPSFFDTVATYLYYSLVPVLTALILYELLGKQGIIYGLILGSISTILELGLLGGITVGILTIVLLKLLQRFVGDHISLLVYKYFIPFITTIIIALLLVFVLSTPIHYMLEQLFDVLLSLEGGNILLLVTLLGAMTAFDLGGPINKVAYVFTLQAYTKGLYIISGSQLLAVGIAPLGIALALYLAPKTFNKEHIKLKKRTLLYGIFGITEGALPHAALDPIRILPSVIIGSATASFLGGLFTLSNKALLPTFMGILTTRNIPLYLVAHGIGIIVTALLLVAIQLIRKKVTHD